MDPFIGTIMAFGFNFAPRGWAKCDGQLLSVSQFTALYSLLGTIYGGDGRTTFGLPDLRGRVAIHHGSGPGLTPRQQGLRSGTETNTLTEANMPPHNHPALAMSAAGTANDAVGNYWSKDAGVQSATYHPGPADAAMAGDAIGNTGGGQAFDNMQPSLAVNWCIALEGIYPSRN